MNTRSESASSCPPRRGFVLGAHRAISLHVRIEGELLVTAGQAWVTLGLAQPAGREDDHVLAAGTRLRVPAGTHLVMEPWTAGEALRFDWCERPAPLAQPRRFDREVVAPSRELALALGQATLALGRLLRGLAGYAEYLVAGRGRVLSRFESNPP